MHFRAPKLGRRPFALYLAPIEVETLGPVAHLELSILSARDLVGEEVSLSLQPSCNPYAKARAFRSKPSCRHLQS